MEAEKKFRLKRRYKTLIRIAYACLIFFAISLVTIIIFRAQIDSTDHQLVVIPIMVILFSVLMGAGILLIVAGGYQNELLAYMRDIRIYRTRKTLMRVIQHLQDDEPKLAIREYLKRNSYPEKDLDNYVYGMIIMTCYNSKNKKLCKQGINRIFDIKKRYEPDKIDFN